MANAHDIEDVLASIRQLVAEEAPAALVRGETRDADAVPKADEAPMPAAAEDDLRETDRLVLGAEHRIVAAAPDADDAEDGAAPDADGPVGTPEMETWADAEVEPALPEAGRPAPEFDPEATPRPTATVSVLPGAKRAVPAPATPAAAAPDEDDALRDLIADVVREELAGPLGERITRNVRKMVRRELRQMMSGEDFD